MKEQILDILIDWDTLRITAHIEGEADSMKCKEEILSFLSEIGDFDEGRFTIEFKRDGDDSDGIIRKEKTTNTGTKKQRN